MEVLAARLQREVLMVTLTIHVDIQDTWEIPLSVAEGVRFCVFALFLAQGSHDHYTTFPVVFSPVRKKQKA